MPPLQPQTNTVTLKDTQRTQLNGIVGRMVDDSVSGTAEIVAGLEAILAALQAQV
jgi:hypothetical protein